MMYFMESGIWSDIHWRKLVQEITDTFIGCLAKLMLAAFGDLVIYKKYAILLGEFKPAVAPHKSMEDDLAKLAFMGKKAIDGLYADGYVLPVMLIHGRGMEVDVYQLSLDAEAFYCLRLHGTFRLISKPTEFGLLLGISPLISAQGFEASSGSLKSSLRVETNQAWRRRTFDCKGVNIPA
ncbi:hypothetical protein BCR41DRAFT_400971 [Lobosporangium transversale]|uniref:Uncharacterized protein n=1 Tax=Lobosporangium transversale TaxID=64571 RepID=A0A1Y2GB76_9FUNG|nr:hypothetical protein BCR41DRAFT_400971 [Lobosporangium transversale]ORZ04716.1 hypothetical protein BCR41DRAFT_400971 [Lobosporangium transversale]|eukprot:XP_021876713.1 hypothetical protein BCR41DRAFT_400971 [Lobosporangium transversale]